MLGGSRTGTGLSIGSGSWISGGTTSGAGGCGGPGEGTGGEGLGGVVPGPGVAGGCATQPPLADVGVALPEGGCVNPAPGSDGEK